MGKLATVKNFAEFPQQYFSFSQANVAATQSQVALKLNVNDATTGSLNITDRVMPWAGSIIAIDAILTNNKTAGAFSVSPTINGTEVASTVPLYRTAMANAKRSASATQDAQTIGLRFNAGDLIGIKLTTDGSFAAGATPDLEAKLWIVFDNVQP